MDQQLINPTKMHEELKLAGLPVVGVSSSGRVDYARALSTAEMARAGEVIRAHDPRLPVQVTTERMTLALWKKMMEGDESEADLLQEILSKGQ